jgi:hypothetical protein
VLAQQHRPEHRHLGLLVLRRQLPRLVGRALIVTAALLEPPAVSSAGPVRAEPLALPGSGVRRSTSTQPR